MTFHKKTPTKIIAHRGASGYFPEHGLSAYESAINMGAEIIEPDIVSTKDGVLIARHETALSQTTDIVLHDEFKDRKRIVEIDGESIEDWFCFDFTWNELKRLKLKQRYLFRPQLKTEDRILSFEEVIELVLLNNSNKNLIIYPELKHTSFHRSIGLPLEERFLDICKRWKLNEKYDPLWVQCFEPSTLIHISKETNLKIFQLIGASSIDSNGNPILIPPDDKPYDFVLKNDPRTYLDLISDEGLKFISRYADGVGIWKNLLLTRNSRNELINTGIAQKIKLNSLELHVYTLRDESIFRISSFKSAADEYGAFFSLNPEAIFTDFPDTALKLRDI